MDKNDQFAMELTADIVSAYVSNNPVAADQLPELMRKVHRSLGELESTETKEQAEPLKPAVSVRKSVSDDAIICLECGKSFKAIKRHLGTEHGLTPSEYRDKWGLKSDYPMTAPGYSKQRSKMARDLGLGRKATN